MNYEEIVCDANNLYRAYKVSVKSSKWKESTQKFMMNFLRFIFEIQDDLIYRTLQNGPTLEFELHDRGRIRPITSIQIRDRIVRHSLCDEVLLPEVRGAEFHNRENDSKSISTNTTNYTEMTVIFYSVTFQSSMTILSMRLPNENCWSCSMTMSLLTGF